MQRIRSIAGLIGPYELIAFLTGFVLMAYELVASRVLAPTMGTSIYVWTSVIGVMIAALAFGYAAGGWLADKRVAHTDIAWLLLGAALAVTGTLIFYAPILSWLTGLRFDGRLQGILAAITLFMPASFLLGMISPYLARLRVRSLTTTGRSVAGLSALNSFGGIMGTFCTGFIFFSLIGSRETLVFLVALLVLCSWMLMPRYRFVSRIALTLVLAVIASVQLAAPARAGVVAAIDTPSAHYEVVERNYRGQNIRVLVTDPHGTQAGVFADGRNDLVFSYIKALAMVTEAAPKHDRILMIGGGIFSLPEYLAKKYPNSQIDVVEIDPQLEAISRQYFHYEPQPNTHVYGQDARAFLHQAAPQTYDLIIVDAYTSDSAVPYSLTTREYVAQLRHALKPGGVVTANFIGSVSAGCAPLLTSMHTSYASGFAKAALFPLAPAQVMQRQNMIGVYADQPVDWVKGLGAPLAVDSSRAVPLTDNHTPLDRLGQRCLDAS